MSWIESHQSLRQHPKVIKAARALGVSKVTLIGHLHCLWWWALDYAQDGNLTAFDPADIAEAAEWTGDAAAFVAALTEAARIGDKPGLLERSDTGLVIHDWYDYAGKLIDRRQTDANRKRASRNADVPKMSDGCPTDVHTPSFVPYPTVPTLPYQPTEPINDDVPPDVRAIQNAYDACGLMLSKTHQDAHLLTIKQAGLTNWQLGWAKAMETGKQNIPAYVARCAESAMLAAQRGNGHSKGAPVPSTTEERKRMYATEEDS